MHNFKDLRVWQKSIELTTDIYKLLASFPTDEKFGLISQLKRAAVSVPSNIAEGAGRNSNKEFNHFLSISLGSLFELETQLIISKNLNLINSDSLLEMNNKISELQKMIFSLKKSYT